MQHSHASNLYAASKWRPQKAPGCCKFMFVLKIWPAFLCNSMPNILVYHISLRYVVWWSLYSPNQIILLTRWSGSLPTRVVQATWLGLPQVQRHWFHSLLCPRCCNRQLGSHRYQSPPFSFAGIITLPQVLLCYNNCSFFYFIMHLSPSTFCSGQLIYAIDHLC